VTTILALDAAWTATEPTGVALVASDGIGWRAVAVAPNYDSFLRLAEGSPVPWTQPGRFHGNTASVPELLEAAHRLANSPVDLVTIDMPIATVPITGRRAADNVISAIFGGRGCSTHTPNAICPGPLGATLSAAFNDAGFPIATSLTTAAQTRRLLEVYPHPALVTLLTRTYRVPYKVGKTRSYWPALSLDERIDMLLVEFSAIHDALDNVLGPVGIQIPTAAGKLTLSALKRYEDALDALVCAWVGIRYMQGQAIGHGDETAAIWCPSAS
jgi:predicted RNase H-like nuclease